MLGLFFIDNGETAPLFIFRAIFADTASHTAESAAASIASNIDSPVGSELAAARTGETDGDERAWRVGDATRVMSTSCCDG